MKDALGFPQSVLVLGGGSDIAKATVTELIAHRLRTVVLAGRRPEVLDRVAGELRRVPLPLGESITVDSIGFDAFDRTTHSKIISEAFSRNGGIDLVIVAFAILGDQMTDEEDPESAMRILDVNFTGAASACMSAAKCLRDQGHGTLMVFSSIAGERVRRANYIYGASKAGLDAYAQGLGDSLIGTGVNVMIVRPGFVHTKMTEGRKPAPFSTTPEEVADVVVKAMQSGTEIVWAPPMLRFVMAIFRHMPRPIFRKIKA